MSLLVTESGLGAHGAVGPRLPEMVFVSIFEFIPQSGSLCAVLHMQLWRSIRNKMKSHGPVSGGRQRAMADCIRRFSRAIHTKTMLAKQVCMGLCDGMFGV